VDTLALSVLDVATVLTHCLVCSSDWCRSHLYCHACSEPPGSAAQPTPISTRPTCHRSPAYRRFHRSRFHTYSYVRLVSILKSTCVHFHAFADGLSIPFFSAGRRTLTMSRSLVDQPDWLANVRRAPPRGDPEQDSQRAPTEGAETPERNRAVQYAEAS
jgi:hypothetical protein